MCEKTETLVGELRGASGRRLLEKINSLPPGTQVSPGLITGLRKRWPADLVALALKIAETGHRRGAKFPAGEDLLFTRELLEQASAHPPAWHRAQRLAPLGRVLDLGCGAGGDLTRLAAAGARVVGLEQDPLAAALARANLDLLGLPGEVIRGRYPGAELPPWDSLYCDPARRKKGGENRSAGRLYDPVSFSPPPGEIRQLLDRSRTWALKWGPSMALDHGSLTGAGGILQGLERHEYELELVSWQGELREAVLWGGEALRGEPVTATVLTGGSENFATHRFHGDQEAAQPPVDPHRGWLLEPDPALIRSGLIAAYAGQLGFSLFAPDIAYLGGDQPGERPFVRSWPVLETVPFSLSRVQEALNRHDAGQLILKKRGFPLDPEELRPRLVLPGTRSITLIIYRSGSAHMACICGKQDSQGT
jgi:SAM-dependent methyltransferase